LGEVQRLQRTLNAAGFAAPGVEFQPSSNAFTGNEIRYLNPSFRDSIKLLQTLLKKVYPDKEFKAVQTRARQSVASAEIWVYEEPPAVEDELLGIDGAVWLAAAKSLGCDVAALKAVAEVESFDPPFTRGDLDEVPLVRLEPHIFWRQLEAKKIDPVPYAQKDSEILYRNFKIVPYRSRTAQYKKLQRAKQIDEEAAMMATSWGRFQIMGFQYRACGYQSVEKFTNAVTSDKKVELQAFVHLLKSLQLGDELQRRDWAGFVRGYNGPTATQNQKYVKAMQAAYLKHSKSGPEKVIVTGYGNQTPQKPRSKGSKN
jgi:hypothetical protein